MALDDAERGAERPREGGPAAPESAIREANCGREDLVRQQRLSSENLRAGGRSGITSEFGRVVITGLDALGNRPGGSEEAESRGPAEPERPDEGEGGGGGLGRVFRDGIQAISRGLRIGEGRPRSARAELGEEAPAATGYVDGRTLGEAPGSGGGLGRMLMDGIQAISRGLRIGEGERPSARAELGEGPSTRTREGEEIEPAGDARRPSSETGDRTAEVSERPEVRLSEIDEFPAPSREALARSVDVLMNALRQTVDSPGVVRLDDIDVRSLETSLRPEDLNPEALLRRAEQFGDLLGMTGGSPSDARGLHQLLDIMPAAERREVSASFERHFGTSLEDQMRGVLGGDDLTRALHLMHRSDTAQGAEHLFAALSGSDRPEDSVVRLLGERTPDQLRQLDQYFQLAYGSSLADRVSGTGLTRAMDLLGAVGLSESSGTRETDGELPVGDYVAPDLTHPRGSASPDIIPEGSSHSRGTEVPEASERSYVPTDLPDPSGSRGPEAIPDRSEPSGDRDAEDGESSTIGLGAHIERDDQGRPTEIEYDDGTTRTIEYDREGPTRIRSSLGGELRRGEDGEWSLVSSEGGETPLRDVQVSNDGVITYEKEEGILTYNTDGSVVGCQRAADGSAVLSQVHYPDGHYDVITYDAAGHPAEVRSTEGETWRRGPEGWDHRDADGNVIEHFDGNVTASSDGTISFIDDNGAGFVRHPNGGVTELGADGSAIFRDAEGNVIGRDGPTESPGVREVEVEGPVASEEPGDARGDDRSEPTGTLGANIERDSQGRPTEIEYPDGTTRTVEYDREGPTRIHSSLGGELRRGEDGEWSLVSSEGGERPVRDVRVADNGAISFETEQGHLTYNTDGSVVGCQRGANGSAVLSQVHYPDGHYDVITYDAAGRPAEVRSTEGDSWRRDSDGWNHRDADGNVTEHFDGNVTASPDGTISFLDDDGAGFVRHPNGGVTECHADGSAIYRDANGNVVGEESPTAAGERVEVEVGPAVLEEPASDIEVVVGEAVIEEPPSDIEVVVGEAVIEESPQDDIEVVFGEAVLEEPEPDIEVVFGEAVLESTERWGRRDYTVLSDGTAEYTVERGDTVWSIARDSLEHRHPDREPSGREILQEVRRIARDSGLEDPNSLHPGDHIVIRPEPSDSAAGETIRPEYAVPPRWPDDIIAQPGTHAVGEGETLDTIARQHLGAEAGPEEIRRFVAEVERINNLPEGGALPDSDMVFLELPGMTRDGGVVTVDSDSTVRTLWQNGTERVQHTDGRGHVHSPTEDGGYTESHWGPRAEENYELEVGAAVIEERASDIEVVVGEAVIETPSSFVEARERPAERPAEGPAERPAERPAAERPAEGPADRPAEVPSAEVLADLAPMAAQLIEHMPPESLAPVIQQMLGELPADSLAPLAAQILDGIPAEALQPIAAEMLRQLPAAVLPSIAGPMAGLVPTNMLAPMAAQMMANMPAETLEPMVAQMIEHMPPEALASVAARMVDGLPAGTLEPLVSQMLERIPADQLAPIAGELIEHVPPDQLAPIVEQLAEHVPPEQLAQLVGPLLDHIPPDQLAQIAAPLIEHIPPEQLAPIVAPLISHIPPEQLGEVGAALIEHVPPEQLAPLAAQLLEHVPPDRLGPIAGELFERVPPDRLAPFAAELIDHVPPDRMGPVAAELLEHVPPEQLAPVAARMIEEMPPEALTPVLAEVLRQLPADSLAPVAAEILSRMPAESLRPIAAQMLRELPAEYLPSVAGPILGFLPSDSLAPMAAEMLANMPPEALEPMIRQMIERMPPERLAPLAARMVGDMPADSLEPVVEQLLERTPPDASTPIAERLVREAAADAPVERTATEVSTPRDVDTAALETAVGAIRAATHRDDTIDTGTEEQDFLNGLRGRSEAELAEMNRIYQDRYGTTLEDEARRELEGSDLQIALNYLSREAGLPAEIPEGVDRAAAALRVEQLHTAALARGATGDADAFCRALEGTSPAERAAMDALYRERYGLSIAQEVNFRLLGDDSTRAFTLLNATDVAGAVPAGVDRAAMEARVERIFQATHRGDMVDTGTEEGDFLDGLRGTTAEERRVMDDIYHERHGRTLSEEIDSELSDTDRQMAYNLLNAEGVAGAAPEVAATVDRVDLRRRMDAIRGATGVDDVIDTGTNSTTILENLRGLSAEERTALDALYLQEHGITLRQQLRAEMDPADFERAATILATGTDAAPPVERPAVDTSGVDRDEMTRLATQIRGATHRDDMIDTGTDDEVILQAIEGRTEAERVVLAEIYQREYGISLAEEIRSEMTDGISNGSLGRARVALEGRESDLTAEGVNTEALQSVVEEIHMAPLMDPTGSGAEGIATLLESRTEEERRAIDTLFLREYGVSLEEYINSPLPAPGQFLAFSDAERDNLTNLLHREDGSADFAGRIHSSLLEMDSTLRGRDADTVEQGLRTTLSVMNSEQIAELDREYRERYHVGLRDALMEDAHLSAETREVLDVYLRGSDRRTDADTERLATVALENEDMTMFEEAFRSASPEARSAFMEAGGEARIRAAFGMHVDDLATAGGADFLSGHASRWEQQVAHALDYARYGHLSLGTSIRDETSVIGDNERALETALGRLTDDERERYRHGRELVSSGADGADLSAEDREAIAYYRDGHAALEGAGNETEVARWEDMIMVEGGSMISRLAAHAGTVYDDSMDDVLSDIEGAGMTDEAWAEHYRRLTTEPEYRQDIEDTLRTYLSEDELTRATTLLDQQAAAGSAEEARTLGRRPILEAIGDADGTFTTTESHVAEAISHMSAEEQRRYRDDADFRRQLDDAVTATMEEGPERDAARRLLDRVARGEEPTMDIITRLQLRAGEQDESDALTEAGVMAGGVALAPMTGGTSLVAAGAFVADAEGNDGAAFDAARTALVGSRSADTIRDLEEEFREHPEVRERILNPTTDEDRRFHDEFYTALRQTMTEAEIQRYAEPLIREGHLAIETRMELNRGIADDNELTSYDDLVTLVQDTSDTAEAERTRILTDDAYQDQVLGHLSAEERQIAVSILENADYVREHGEMRPADALRAHMVGSGTGEDEIREILSRLSPEEQQRVRDEYAATYGRDLRADLVSELGGGDLTEAMRMTRGPASAEEDFSAALDDYMESRDGLGSTLVDSWDGTGHAADDALHQYAAAMTEFSARFEELPPERRRELEENLSTALEQFRESRGAMADAVVDSVIAIAAVGGAVFTDGVSLSLLACTGFGAAIFKVATRAAIMGGDYDFASMAGMDAATGFVDGFTSMLGPGEIGAMLRVGERAASTAATRVAAEGGELLLEAGGREALERSMTRAVRDAFVSGSDRISEETVERIAREAAREGLDEAGEAELRRLIRTSLSESISTESRGALARIGTEYGLNMAAGGLGGGSSGMIRGFAEWDPERSFEDNLALVGRMTLTSAAFGAGGAATFTAIFGAGSTMVRGLRDHFRVRPGEALSPEQLAEAASRMGVPEGHLRETPEGDLVLTGESPARAPGDREAIVPPPPERVPGDREAIVPPPPERVPGDREAIVPPPPERVPSDREAIVPPPERVPSDREAIVPPEADAPRGVAHADPPSSGTRGDGIDPHSETMPPPEVREAPTPVAHDGPSSTPLDAATRDRLLSRLGELDMTSLTPEQRIALLERVAGHEMFQQATVDSYVAGMERLMTNWRDLPLEQRVQQVEQFMNEFGRRHDMPEVRVRMARPDEDLGEALASYHHGEIVLRPSALEDPAQINLFMDSLYHEFAHNAQDGLVIRNLADEVGVGRVATPDEVTRLRDLYRERVGEELPEDQLTRALEARDGRPLAPEEAARARELMDSFRNRPDLQPEVQDARAAMRAVQAELDALASASGSPTDLIGRLAADDGTLARQLFGTETLPRDIGDLVDTFRSIERGERIPFPEAEAEEVLTRALRERQQEVLPVLRRALRDYFESPHELEAFILGRRANDALRERHAVGDGLSETMAPPPPERTVRGGDEPRPSSGERDTLVDAEPPHARASGDSPRDTIIDAPAEVPPAIRDYLDRAGILPEERAAFMSYVQDNPLFRTELMDRFGREVSDITSAWPDRMGLSVEAQAGAERLQGAFSDYRRAVLERLRAPDGSNEGELVRMLTRPEEMRAELSRQGRLDEEMTRLIDGYVGARDANAEAQRVLHEEVSRRTAQIEEALNRIADEEGLPRVRVMTAGSEMGRARGGYIDGEIRLRDADLLGVRDPMMLMETAYHEFVHNGQDALVARSVIDSVEDRLGRPLSAADFDRLRELRREFGPRRGGSPALERALEDTVPGIDPRVLELQDLEARFRQVRDSYRELTGGTELSDDHLGRVLEARDGRRLTPEERARVDEMMPDWRSASETAAATRGAEADLRVVTSQLTRLYDADGPSTLVRRLAEEMELPEASRTMTRHIFGSAGPPEEVRQLIARGVSGAAEESAARELLTDALLRQRDQLEVYQEALYYEYRSEFHEQEAFLIGGSLRSRAEERGGTAVASDAASEAGPVPAEGARSRETLPFGARSADYDGPRSPGVGEDRPTVPIPPPEVVPSLTPGGDAIAMGPHEFGVIDQSADTVLLRRLSRPLPPEEPVSVTADDLARDYTRIGDTDYYYRTRDRSIYRARRTESGGMEVRRDPNITAMRRERFLERSGGIAPEDFPRPGDSAAAREAE